MWFDELMKNKTLTKSGSSDSKPEEEGNETR
jgi:hypothetical protein